jgi:hypothetical protein
MAFWIFKCNPEKYRLSQRLADPNPATTWRVTNSKYRRQIKPGDTVFIWETGPNRAVRAVVRVDQGPREIPELQAELRYCVHIDTARRFRVRGTFTHRGLNLSHTMLRDVPGLEDLSIFRRDVCQRPTNFPVTAAEGAILLRLVKGK